MNVNHFSRFFLELVLWSDWDQLSDIRGLPQKHPKTAAQTSTFSLFLSKNRKKDSQNVIWNIIYPWRKKRFSCKDIPTVKISVPFKDTPCIISRIVIMWGSIILLKSLIQNLTMYNFWNLTFYLLKECLLFGIVSIINDISVVIIFNITHVNKAIIVIKVLLILII